MIRHPTAATVVLLAPRLRYGTAHADRTWLLSDNEEGAQNWTGSGTGADWTVALSTDTAESPTHSLSLVTRQTGPTAGDQVQASRSLSYPSLAAVHFTASINQGNITGQGPTSIILRWNGGAHDYSAGLLYDQAVHKFYYWNLLGTLVEIPALAMTLAADTWYHWELTINLTAHQYLSAACGTTYASLAGIAAEDDGAGAGSYLTVALKSSTAAALPQGAYFDNIALTNFVP